MGIEWQAAKLVDITTKIGDGLHGTPIYTENGEYHFINGNNFENGHIVFKPTTKQVGHSEYLKYRKPLSDRTLFVSINGTIGNIAYYRGEKIVLGKSACYLNIKEGIDKQFIRYVLSDRTFQGYLESFSTGTTIKNVSLKSMREFPLFLPSLDEQKKIAHTLSSLDNKIQLNRQTNETLEKMAQALFKSWFVDFDPVIDNALKAGNTIPDELQDRAERRQQQLAKPDHQPLPDAISQLFPSVFEMTEALGWVPMGWVVKRAEMLSEKIAMGPFGSNLKVATFVESGVPIISGHHLKGFLLDEHKHKFITNEHAEKLKNSTVFPGDIIFTHAGNIGQVALIPKNVSFEKFVISQRQFYLRPKLSKVSAAYLLYYFKSHLGQYKLLSNASQVGVPSIARPSSHLKGIELVVPSMELMNIFDEQCNSIIGKIMGIRESVESLTKLRDTLLPKLISGELRLPSDALSDAKQKLADETNRLCR